MQFKWLQQMWPMRDGREAALAWRKYAGYAVYLFCFCLFLGVLLFASYQTYLVLSGKTRLTFLPGNASTHTTEDYDVVPVSPGGACGLRPPDPDAATSVYSAISAGDYSKVDVSPRANASSTKLPVLLEIKRGKALFRFSTPDRPVVYKWFGNGKQIVAPWSVLSIDGARGRVILRRSDGESDVQIELNRSQPPFTSTRRCVTLEGAVDEKGVFRFESASPEKTVTCAVDEELVDGWVVHKIQRSPLAVTLFNEHTAEELPPLQYNELIPVP